MKIIALILIVVSINSCKSFNIDTIRKQLVTPGLPSGVLTLKYNTTLTASETFTIKSLSIKNSDYKNLDLVITELPSGLLLSKDSAFEKGTYYIETTIPYDSELLKTVDILELLIVTENDHEIILVGQSVLVDNLLMK